MQRITGQSHTADTFYYSFSKLLERGAYYGLRALLIVYMVDQLAISKEDAFSLYGIFTLFIYGGQLIGGLLGDLVLGNKLASIIGVGLQAIGAFSLCIPSIYGTYLGMGLIIFGGGLYTPNIYALFGQHYLHRTKLLDAGFMLFYMAINLGSFLGILLISYLGETYGWNAGFVVAGLWMLLSIIPLLFTSSTDLENIPKSKTTVEIRIVYVIVFTFVSAIFWGIYEISSIQLIDIQTHLIQSKASWIPSSMWSSFNGIFIIPISIVAILLWSYFYSTSFSKLFLGFSFFSLALLILYFIPNSGEIGTIPPVLIVIFLMTLGEFLIVPIVNAIIVKYSHPKYLAIIFSVFAIPTVLVSKLIGYISEPFYLDPSFATLLALIITGCISIGLLLLVLLRKVVTPTIDSNF